jgi:hypothetical protein
MIELTDFKSHVQNFFGHLTDLESHVQNFFGQLIKLVKKYLERLLTFSITTNTLCAHRSFHRCHVGINILFIYK